MAEQQTIKCAILVGMREDGSVFLETHGTEQNLIILDGLLDYGKDYVDEEWKSRKAATAKALAEASQAEAEAVEADEIIAPVAEPKPKRKTPVRKKKEAIVDAEV
jgi:hypothetical protein